MNKPFSLVFVFLLVGPACAASLPRATPESQGVSPAAVLDFVTHADAEIDAMNSFMLVRHGRVVAEGWWSPYRADDPHMLYSLSKSFTSTAVGMAIAEGKMSLDDRVVDRFPPGSEKGPPTDPGDNLSAMRVRDLLRMATGHTAEQLKGYSYNDGSGVANFMALPPRLKPGTHFLYNTPGTYVAGAIVQQATGQTVHDYLTPRLFEPLGIQDPWWETTTEGSSTAGFGLNLRTEDIAKFGQLLLQRGEWEGEQLVPAAWVDEATRLQIANGSDPDSDWEQGYGYQYWRCTPGCYRGDGAFGQYCIVIPERDAVVVITSGVRDMGAVMRLVWDRLLPGLRDEPLAVDPAARAELAEKLASLRVATPEGEPTSPIATEVAESIYRVADDPLGLRAVRLRADGDGSSLTFANEAGRHRVAIGHGAWERGRVDSIEGFAAMTNGLVEPPSGTVAVAASGAWTADDTYHLRLCLNETPFYHDVTLRFDEGKLTIDVEQNAVFGDDRKQPTRTGERVE